MFRALTIVMLAGAVLALLTGIAIAVVLAAEPGSDLGLMLLKPAAVVFGSFLVMGLLAMLAASTQSLSSARGVEPAPAEPVVAPRLAKRTEEPDLKTAFEQMRTYIDLEMWELALDKASFILGKWPGTNEAELVSKNLPEIRWKVESKPSPDRLSSAEQRELQQKGLAELVRHVKTYGELGMWELARQKAITLMKSFPDSTEANELARTFPEIEKKAALQASAPETPVTTNPS